MPKKHRWGIAEQGWRWLRFGFRTFMSLIIGAAAIWGPTFLRPNSFDSFFVWAALGLVQILGLALIAYGLVCLFVLITGASGIAFVKRLTQDELQADISDDVPEKEGSC